MKQLFLLAGFVCLIAMLLPACAPPPEPVPEAAAEPVFDQAEEAALREDFEKFKLAYNNHDVKAIPSFFLDETMVGWTNERKGASAIEKRYTEIFEQSKDIHAEIAEDFGVLFVSPTVAIWRTTPEYTGRNDADGNARPPGKSRGAVVMVKKEGHWRCAAMFERPIPE